MEGPGEQSSRPETLLALVVARLCLGPGPSRLAGDSSDGWLSGGETATLSGGAVQLRLPLVRLLVAGELRHWKLPSSRLVQLLFSSLSSQLMFTVTAFLSPRDTMYLLFTNY